MPERRTNLLLLLLMLIPAGPHAEVILSVPLLLPFLLPLSSLWRGKQKPFIDFIVFVVFVVP